MEEDRFTLGNVEFWKKCVEEEIRIPEKLNKGEFYKAKKKGKTIYLLGTLHHIVCSKFADQILEKVRYHLHQDGVLKIDTLWTESFDYLRWNHPRPILDCMFYKGLKIMSKRTDVLDKYTWGFYDMEVNESKYYDQDIKYWVNRSYRVRELCREYNKKNKSFEVILSRMAQSFMRGCPPEKFSPSTQYHFLWRNAWRNLNDIVQRNKWWVSRLEKGGNVQFVVAGASHNWYRLEFQNYLKKKVGKSRRLT
jgi:hypothetical protein